VISRLPNSWYITLADLALILFLVTASAVSQSEAAASVPGNPLPAETVPVAVYRAAPGVPPLGDWLADQRPDARQSLTIIARYSDGDMEDAAGRAARLAGTIGGTIMPAPRIIVEAAERAEEIAVLSYDRPELGTTIATVPARENTETSPRSTANAGS